MPGTLTLFVDTNLFIQCRDAKGLPWAELGDFDRINLVVCRPVQKEIDDKKGHPNNRISKRARAASSLLGSVIKGGMESVDIRSASPAVTLALRTDLKSSDLSQSPDDQLVEVAIRYSSGHPGDDVRVFSNDNGVLASAHAVDLPFLFIPEGWLLEPEESNADRNLRAAQAEIARLKKNEPVVEVAAPYDTTPVQLTYRRYRELTAEDVEALVERAKAAFPGRSFRRSRRKQRALMPQGRST
jgi:hypothetical protein